MQEIYKNSENLYVIPGKPAGTGRNARRAPVVKLIKIQRLTLMQFAGQLCVRSGLFVRFARPASSVLRKSPPDGAGVSVKMHSFKQIIWSIHKLSGRKPLDRPGRWC